MITVRLIPWPDLLYNRPALKPTVYGHMAMNDTNVLHVAGHPVGVAWDRARWSPRYRAMLPTTNHLGTPRRLGNCRNILIPHCNK